MALLLTKAGDVETNPGSTTLNKRVWIKKYMLGNRYPYGATRLNTGSPQMRRYPPSTIHRYLDLPSTQRIQTHTSHGHNTTTTLPTLVQAPYLLPTNTTHTTATKQNTDTRPALPCSHWIVKAQPQSSHPLTPLSTHTAQSQTHTHVTHSTYASHHTHLKHVTCTRQNN